MRKIFIPVLLLFLLTACNLPRAIADPHPSFATDTPSDQPCYFNWATQPLPDLSTQIQAAMNATGLTGVSAIAEAYGENCYDAKTDQPVGFGAIETDFHITVKVAELTNKDDLGNLLEKILVVLDGFPIGKIPGSEPGYIGVSFQTGNDELNLSFTAKAGKSARDQGLHGAALFEELQNK